MADVRVHVASYNTAAATELCLRSMRRLAAMPFALTVGDAGSSDGSQEMLRRLAPVLDFELEVAAGGRSHAQWLDRWYASCQERYCVFSDSDVEYLRSGWLAQMVGAAAQHEAALVATRIQARDGVDYRHPTTGARRVLAARPEPWLMLIDVARTRPDVHTGFGYEDRLRDDGIKVAYDIGAAFFRELEAAELPWTAMPDDFSGAYRHYGGLSWQGGFKSGLPWRRTAKQFAKRSYVRLRLERTRLLDRFSRS